MRSNVSLRWSAGYYLFFRCLFYFLLCQPCPCLGTQGISCHPLFETVWLTVNHVTFLYFQIVIKYSGEVDKCFLPKQTFPFNVPHVKPFLHTWVKMFMSSFNVKHCPLIIRAPKLFLLEGQNVMMNCMPAANTVFIVLLRCKMVLNGSRVLSEENKIQWSIFLVWSKLFSISQFTSKSVLPA